MKIHIDNEIGIDDIVTVGDLDWRFEESINVQRDYPTSHESALKIHVKSSLALTLLLLYINYQNEV